MRVFPRAGGRAVLACLLVATLGGAAVPLARAADSEKLKIRQEQVQQQIEQAQHDLESASQAASKAKAQLARAEEQLTAARADFAAKQSHADAVAAQLAAASAENETMQAALEVARANLATAKAEVAAAQAALEAQRKTVKDTVVSIYQQGPPGLMMLTGYLASETPADLIRKLEYADTLLEDQTSAFDELHAAEVALVAKKDQERLATNAAREQADLAARKLAEVQELSQQATQAAEAARLAQEQVTLTVAAREKAQRHAEQAVARDRQQLRELKQQEERIKQLIIEAIAQEQAQGFVGNSDGFLLRPVPGRVTSPFGWRDHPIYHYWGQHDGTDFSVSCGEPMRAAASGKVLSRVWSAVYGNRLYINVGKVNGKNLTIVYNHASSYRVGIGAKVKRGEVVGYAGSTGWSTGCHLHFTVLENGTAVDPMKYL